MLLTRAPLYLFPEGNFRVRLACLRHAASVDSEPGSNSRLKPSCRPLRRRSEKDRLVRASLRRTSYLPCENDQAKPDRLSRLARSTLLSKILMTDRLSGVAWIEARTVTSGCPRTYCANQIRIPLQALAFLREPSKPIEVPMLCQAVIPWESRA